MELTKDTLLDLAGWPAMKSAKTLRAAGSVLSATLTETENSCTAKGVVQEGRKKFACGLVVRSKTDADSQCSCPASRRDGQICAHVVAVALEALESGVEESKLSEAADRPAESAANDSKKKSAQRSAIPTRLPLVAQHHPDRDGIAVLTRSAIAGHRFVSSAGGLDLEDLESGQRIPTRLNETSAEFQQKIAPLLQRSELESRVNLPHKWLRLNADHLHCMFHVECSDGLIESLRMLPGTPEVALEVEGSLRRIDLKLRFSYPAETAANPAAEELALAKLGACEFGAIRQDGECERIASGHLRGEPEILEFYAGPLDRLITAGEWDIQIGERFAHVTAEVEKVRPRLEVASSGEGWLDFDLSFPSGESGETLSEAEVRRLLESGQSGAKSRSGRKIAFDRGGIRRLYGHLEDLQAEQKGGGGLRRVKNSYLFYAEEVVREFTTRSSVDFEENAPETPGFKAELRPYQEFSLAWLHRRIGEGYGAILADEMGLGKTVQTIALVASLSGRSDAGAVLIVAPTSLLATWRKELERFLPQCSVLVLHGPQRGRKMGEIGEHDIVITSYGSLVRDIEKYPPEPFLLVVADEASYLRNPRTKTYRAVSQVDASARLALTGTPVENSIQDLWAIMDFAVPDYLGRREDFLAKFGSGSEDASRLRARIAPFVLRRTKVEVAPDLPSKIEKIFYCELNSAQRQAYEVILNEKRKLIGNSLNVSDINASKMALLTLLLRLRQTCCDLRLLPGAAGNANPQKGEDSAKLATLRTILEGAIPAGHRVLIFSQFVSMLDLAKDLVIELGHEFEYLVGSTSAADRAASVERFQGSDGAPVFLISLKAGGYGLTLTAADTVVHLDPWWNPAVESQATDRAHRIGQAKPVTAYKLITTGTVEEKILNLQQRKQHLISAALDDEKPLMSGLSNEELVEILT